MMRRVGNESRKDYLPAARRWKRVRFSIFLCFFFRMRLRRFLISEPMTWGNLVVGSPEMRNDGSGDSCELGEQGPNLPDPVASRRRRSTILGRLRPEHHPTPR